MFVLIIFFGIAHAQMYCISLYGSFWKGSFGYGVKKVKSHWTRALRSLLSFKTSVLAALSMTVLAVHEHSETICLVPLVGQTGHVVFTF